MSETRGPRPDAEPAVDRISELIEAFARPDLSPEEGRRALHRLSLEIESRYAPGTMGDAETVRSPVGTVRGYSHLGSEIHSALELSVLLSDSTETPYANLMYDRGIKHVVLFVDPSWLRGSARTYGRAAERAFRELAGTRGWVVWGGRGDDPFAREIHVPLELPDPGEGERAYAALAEAWKRGDADAIRRALAETADALNRHMPYHASVIPSFAKDLRYVQVPADPRHGDWLVQFMSGTGGTRLLINGIAQELSFPSQGVHLSWTFQDAFRRLFGERAQMPHPTYEGRRIFVPIGGPAAGRA